MSSYHIYQILQPAQHTHSSSPVDVVRALHELWAQEVITLAPHLPLDKVQVLGNVSVVQPDRVERVESSHRVVEIASRGLEVKGVSDEMKEYRLEKERNWRQRPKVS